MPAQGMNELREFHRFLSEKLELGNIQWTPEEAVDQWRHSHPDEQASEEDIAAIQEALNDMAAGDRGVPFEEFDRDFRKRHNLPGKP